MKGNIINIEYLLDFLKSNKDYFKNEFHIEEIGIFGSYARGEETPESDIDIIIEFDDDVKNIYDIKTELKKIFKVKFNKDTDIARRKYLKKRIKDQILKDVVYV